MVDNVVHLQMGPDETRNPVYTAMGVFITAYARDVTIRAAQEHYDVFAYADTDSLHLLLEDDPPTLNIHPDNLGAWKREYKFTSAMFIRAKQYIEHVGPGMCKQDHEHIPGCEYVTHIAGLPRGIGAKVTFDDVLKTKRFEGKLRPHRVPGGIVLEDVDFTLTV